MWKPVQYTESIIVAHLIHCQPPEWIVDVSREMEGCWIFITLWEKLPIADWSYTLCQDSATISCRCQIILHLHLVYSSATALQQGLHAWTLLLLSIILFWKWCKDAGISMAGERQGQAAPWDRHWGMLSWCRHSSAALVLGRVEDVLGRKKRMMREEASMRNKMSVHRTEAKQSSFHWYSPITQRQPKSWGEEGSSVFQWIILRKKIKLMYCPGKIGAHHQHQRNLIIGGLSEENAFNFYLIRRHAFSWKREGDPIVKLHQCSPQVLWKPPATICDLQYGSFGECHSQGELPLPDMCQTGLGAPWDSCALHFKSEEAQPAWLLCSYFG